MKHQTLELNETARSAVRDPNFVLVARTGSDVDEDPSNVVRA